MSLLKIIADKAITLNLTSSTSNTGTTRYLISESFTDTQLSTNWTVSGSQTITFNGIETRISGSNSIKDFSQIFKHTGYGLSTIRNYTLEIDFKFNTTGSNSKGIYVGLNSQRNDPTYPASCFALLDPSTGYLQIISSPGTGSGTIRKQINTGLPSLNTSDSYQLCLKMDEGISFATIKNLTANTSKELTFVWDFTTSGVNLRPNISHYCFGVCGTTDVQISGFRVSTDQILNPDILFVGDSITVGYNAGDPIRCYAYKLKALTAKSIQVMAGGGLNILDTIINIPEILVVNPQYVFLNIGTNAGGTFTDYQTIVTTLTNAGIEVIPLLTPNGGNPATGGTLNNNIATTYSTKYIDLYSNGWSTMSVGNGEMSDGVHPTEKGEFKIVGLIKNARPDIFNL